MSSANELHIMNLMCTVRDRFNDLTKKINESGYEVILTSSYRTSAEQKKLYNAYKNQSGGRAAKSSKHTLKIAVDLNLKKNGVLLKKSSSREEWEASGIPAIAKNMGFRWGGDFIGNYDPVHFDLGNDFTVNNLTGELENVNPTANNMTFQCYIEDFLKHFAK